MYTYIFCLCIFVNFHLHPVVFLWIQQFGQRRSPPPSQADLPDDLMRLTSVMNMMIIVIMMIMTTMMIMTKGTIKISM